MLLLGAMIYLSTLQEASSADADGRTARRNVRSRCVDDHDISFSAFNLHLQAVTQ